MERNLSPRRRAYDLAMRALVWLSALLTCALLVFLIGYIFYRGAGHRPAARRGSRHLSHGVRREPQGRRAH